MITFGFEPRVGKIYSPDMSFDVLSEVEEFLHERDTETISVDTKPFLGAFEANLVDIKEHVIYDYATYNTQDTDLEFCYEGVMKVFKDIPSKIYYKIN